MDPTPAMVHQFQQNVAGTALGENSEVVVGDIRSASKRLSGREFDLIVMSFVLSSMEREPDLNVMASLLRPGGLLVVADSNPVYTALNPYYAVLVKGRKVALRTRPVNPLELAESASNAGLEQIELDGVGSGAQSYSFVAVYRKRGGPPG